MRTLISETKTSLPVIGNKRETSDDYRGVIASYGRYRVITCNGDLQWILQRRKGGTRADGKYWHGLAYCTEKSALVRLSRAHSGHTWPELDALPTHFRKGGVS